MKHSKERSKNMPEKKRFSEVVDWNTHIETYRIIQFVQVLAQEKIIGLKTC